MTAHLWKPRLEELPEQCASCPFKKGNDAQFGVIVGKLRRKNGLNGKVTKAVIDYSRAMIRMDTIVRGDFSCHCTVYDEKMNLKSVAEHRQCPGATEFYRSIKQKK